MGNPAAEQISRIGPKHQVTIPQAAFKQLRLQVGDFVSFRVKEREILVRPQKLIPTAQEWFWSKEWQDGEKKASEDIKKGLVRGPFTSRKALSAHLKTLK